MRHVGVLFLDFVEWAARGLALGNLYLGVVHLVAQGTGLGQQALEPGLQIGGGLLGRGGRGGTV